MPASVLDMSMSLDGYIADPADDVRCSARSPERFGKSRSGGWRRSSDMNLIGASDNQVGDVSGFAPPGDIHRVHNTGAETAISIHVYGTHVSRVGSSARRYYD